MATPGVAPSKAIARFRLLHPHLEEDADRSLKTSGRDLLENKGEGKGAA